MTMDEQPRGGWNLFARVLQEILTAHGYGLGYLDDRAELHPERELLERAPQIFEQDQERIAE